MANLRVDQAWGSAQIMGPCMTSMRRTTVALALAQLHWRAVTRMTKLGWVIGGGIKLNTPSRSLAQGDYFQAQVNYTQGALRYVFQTAQPSWSINDTGNSAGYGVIDRRCV